MLRTYLSVLFIFNISLAFSQDRNDRCSFPYESSDSANVVAQLISKYEVFQSLSDLHGCDDIQVKNAYNAMLDCYEASLNLLDSRNFERNMLKSELSFNQYFQQIINWRFIVNKIIDDYGQEYYESLLYQWHSLNVREDEARQYESDINLLEGSLADNLKHEMLLYIYADRFNDFYTNFKNFIKLIPIHSREYYKYFEDIYNALKYKGVYQGCFALLSDVHEYSFCNAKDENLALYLHDLYLTDHINLTDNLGLWDNMFDLILPFVVHHETYYDTLGDEVPSHTTPDKYIEKLFALSRFYSHLNQKERVLNYLSRVQTILINYTVVQHNLYEAELNERKAVYFYNINKQDLAKYYIKKAINILNVDNHLNHKWPLSYNAALASIYLDEMNYEDAILILEKCAEHCQYFPLVDDKLSSSIYTNLMLAYEGMGEYDKMAVAARNAYNSLNSDFNHKTWGMKKNNVIELYNSSPLSFQLEWISSRTLNNELMAPLCYDIALSQKGYLINYDKSVANNVFKCSDEELVIAYNNYIKSISQQSDSLWYYEGQFLLQYMGHKEFRNNRYSVNWKNLRAKLLDKDILIEFTRCLKQDPTTATNVVVYAALLLKRDWDSPKMIELCDESELEKLMKDGTMVYKKNDAAYSCIWGKLESYFNKGDNIYFAPHGMIHQMNIEVLCGTDGKPMNKKCNVYRLSSTGNLLEESEDLKYLSATLYGGLNYDIDTTAMLTINVKYKTQPYLRKNFINNYSGQVRSRWGSLDGTALEVRNISEFLKSKNIPTATFMDEYGTEDSFKELSGNSSSIIHIATHGFYLEDKAAQKEGFYESACNQFTSMISPLKRCGLIFSGGQHAWLGREIPEGIDDGVLTAEEVAGMNLTGTDLLILSACQTGLGEITGEGVEGLQRGFKIAGVNTIIMSLWEVSDLATETMMTTFYKYLTNGKSKREAFDLAVNKVREKTIKMEKSGELRKLHPQDPHLWIAEGHWAAFIMLD